MPVQSFTATKQYPSFSGIINEVRLPVAYNTTAPITYTPADILSGFILRDTNGAIRTDTFPAASVLVPLIEGAQVGSSIRILMQNAASGAFTLTVAPGAGGTAAGTMTVAQLNLKEFLLVVTAIGASPAYTLYSLGSSVF